MVYEIPESKRSLRQNKFEFKISGSQALYAIPKPQFLPLSITEMMIDATLSEEDAETTQLEVFRYLIGLIPGAVKEQIESDQLAELFKAWQESGKATLKKSSASPSSRARKRRR